jgi:hypothetical protein
VLISREKDNRHGVVKYMCLMNKILICQ